MQTAGHLGNKTKVGTMNVSIRLKFSFRAKLELNW
jgi:hypothetical protein